MFWPWHSIKDKWAFVKSKKDFVDVQCSCGTLVTWYRWAFLFLHELVNKLSYRAALGLELKMIKCSLQQWKWFLPFCLFWLEIVMENNLLIVKDNIKTLFWAGKYAGFWYNTMANRNCLTRKHQTWKVKAVTESGHVTKKWMIDNEDICHYEGFMEHALI